MGGIRVSDEIGGGRGGSGDRQANLAGKVDNKEQYEENAAATNHGGDGQGSARAALSDQVCEVSAVNTAEATSSDSKINTQSSVLLYTKKCRALPGVYCIRVELY